MKSSFFAAIAVLWTAVVNAAPATAEAGDVELVGRQDSSYICNYGTNLGQLVAPTPGTTITQVRGSSDYPSFEVIYCSAEYFKTSSLGLTVGLARPDSADDAGAILALDYKPVSGVAPAGFYGYRFNITIYPGGGDYVTGEQTLSVFEVASGYYNPRNYRVKRVNLNFVVVDA